VPQAKCRQHGSTRSRRGPDEGPLPPGRRRVAIPTGNRTWTPAIMWAAFVRDWGDSTSPLVPTSRLSTPFRNLAPTSEPFRSASKRRSSLARTIFGWKLCYPGEKAIQNVEIDRGRGDLDA